LNFDELEGAIVTAYAALHLAVDLSRSDEASLWQTVGRTIDVDCRESIALPESSPYVPYSLAAGEDISINRLHGTFETLFVTQDSWEEFRRAYSASECSAPFGSVAYRQIAIYLKRHDDSTAVMKLTFDVSVVPQSDKHVLRFRCTQAAATPMSQLWFAKDMPAWRAAAAGVVGMIVASH
jgi:hypothetical protein